MGQIIKKILPWSLRILGGSVVVILLFAVVGSIYQWQASQSDRNKYPPPGQMIAVGDHRLHLHCTGSGSPTVILESGSINTYMSWTKVQPKVTNFTRVCSYDRAGHGWSSSISEPQTGEDIANNLYKLLNKSGEEQPFILAGHSRGGLYVRTFQELYPETVSGLILLDSANEPEFKNTPRELQEALDQSFEEVGSLFEMGRWLAPIGLVRLLEIPQQQIRNLPLSDEEKAVYAAMWSQSHVWKAVMIQENQWANEEFRPDPPDTLGSLPIIVIRRGQPRQDIPGLTEEQQELNERLSRDAQQRLAYLSANGKLWVAEESGHMIPWEQPEIVVDAIQDIWDQTRDTELNPANNASENQD